MSLYVYLLGTVTNLFIWYGIVYYYNKVSNTYTILSSYDPQDTNQSDIEKPLNNYKEFN